MAEEDNDELSESQKLTPKDKKQIQDGACVNCALVSFVFMGLEWLFSSNGLGTWQSIFYCEFDGPRRRTFYIRVQE